MFESYHLKPKNMLGNQKKKKKKKKKRKMIKAKALSCSLVPSDYINKSIPRFRVVALWSILFNSNNNLGSLVGLHLFVHLFEV